MTGNQHFSLFSEIFCTAFSTFSAALSLIFFSSVSGINRLLKKQLQY